MQPALEEVAYQELIVLIRNNELFLRRESIQYFSEKGRIAVEDAGLYRGSANKRVSATSTLKLSSFRRGGLQKGTGYSYEENVLEGWDLISIYSVPLNAYRNRTAVKLGFLI
jgi:hypothetical protein